MSRKDITFASDGSLLTSIQLHKEACVRQQTADNPAAKERKKNSKEFQTV